MRDPRRVALVWLDVYLLVSGVVLAVGGHGVLAIIHAVVVAIAALTILPKNGAARVAGNLIPLFVAPILYVEVPLLITALGTTYHDTLMQGWELALFGTQPSRTLAVAIPVTWLSEVLHAGYLAYYPVIFVPSLLLWARGEREGLAQTVLAVTITYTMCFVIFAMFPVEGPRYLWSAPDHVPSGPMRSLALKILVAGSSRGAAFPSAHMAIVVAQAVMAWRWQRRIRWSYAVIAVLVGVGAVYGGFHYAVDVLAGSVVGFGVAWAIMGRRSSSDLRGTKKAPTATDRDSAGSI